MEDLLLDELKTASGGVSLNARQSYGKTIREALKKGDYKSALSTYFSAERSGDTGILQNVNQVLTEYQVTVKGRALMDAVGHILHRG